MNMKALTTLKPNSRTNRFSNSDKCSVPGCAAAARSHANLSFHRFPPANMRFVYRPGNVPGKVEKTDMLEVWKTVTKVTDIHAKSKVCSLHFVKSDYIFNETASTRRTLKKCAIPSCKLSQNRAALEEMNDIRTGMSGVLQDAKKMEKNGCCNGEEPAESIPVVPSNRACMLPRCIRSEKDLEIATGIHSFSIINAIIKIAGKMFVNESDIITPRNRIIMTYVKLKQNLDYSFLAILFNFNGTEQCEEIFYSTLKVLSKCFKSSIALPLYEEVSESWPAHFSGIKIVLESIDIYMEGHDNSYKVLIGSSLGGFISYVSAPYEREERNTDIFQDSSLTKILKPGDAIMLEGNLSLEELCRVNKWICIRPKTVEEHAYLGRFDEQLKNFGIIKTVIPDRIVPIIEEILIVICGTLNISSLGTGIPLLEID